MYNTFSTDCSFEKYISNQNQECPIFFQRSKSQACLSTTSQVWYEKQVMGTNILGMKMKTLSWKAKLSVIYMNHCLRVTCTTPLDRYGFKDKSCLWVVTKRQVPYCRTAIVSTNRTKGKWVTYWHHWLQVQWFQLQVCHMTRIIQQI